MGIRGGLSPHLMTKKDMERKIYLEYVRVDIYEYDYNEGLGKHTGCGYEETIGKSFDTMDDAKKFLVDSYALIDDNSPNGGEFDLETNEDVMETTKGPIADHSDKQNGGWMDATEEEQKLWRKGKMKLYLEDYWIQYHYIAKTRSNPQST